MDKCQILNAIKEHYNFKTNAEFARFLGISSQNLKNWYDRKSFNTKVIVKKCSDFNPSFIITGDGDMFRFETNENVPRKINYWQDNYASGGGLITYDDIKENAKQIIIDLPEFRECTDAINLYGDSMSPRYKSGQIILLKEWKESYIEYGNPYLVITQQGNKMLKVLREVKNKMAQVKCESYNPDYDSFTINKTDIIKLFVVMGAIEKSKI